MCRWLAYLGNPIYLEELIYKPKYSLIEQSLAARTSETVTNGDGFGVGWYGSRATPGVYRNIRPAWNDTNLKDLAAQIASPLFLAHVRAATSTAVQQTNCHPFRYGKWLFVHNGVIENFQDIKRDLVFGIDPKLYPAIEGSTDSEIMFYLALTFGLVENPIEALEMMVGFIERISQDNWKSSSIQMTLGISEGTRLIAVRYSTIGRSRTLYYSKNWRACEELNPECNIFSENARLVVSEPLTDLTDDWEEVPESTAIVIHPDSMVMQSFQPRSL
ncbi:class II glutamine amidotransferase [Mastigocoleus sp. MO_188.B34]|uniref:class II glutamine amidotransferase n=1 Tax=Mastigocoleus sp. MO_188.B34 TaxID=3036635 RepID=UPI0026132EA5|nr:class II glutamine amidotransferase [Mastigocoleus sp. MO_188.B34]MDJ0698054.1 class II glutamine amidotransferase [Mastigocoleus sp. MO_188.B34]